MMEYTNININTYLKELYDKCIDSEYNEVIKILEKKVKQGWKSCRIFFPKKIETYPYKLSYDKIVHDYYHLFNTESNAIA